MAPQKKTGELLFTDLMNLEPLLSLLGGQEVALVTELLGHRLQSGVFGIETGGIRVLGRSQRREQSLPVFVELAVHPRRIQHIADLNLPRIKAKDHPMPGNQRPF